MNRKHIAIIGAGFTGLTAAYELAKKGYNITIFEKGSTIGGLAGGFTVQGASLEKAYHHLFKTDTAIQLLVKELGMEEELQWFDSKVAMITRRESIFEIFPFNGALDLLKYTPLSFFARIRAGIVTLFLQKYTHWGHFVSVTATNWMKRWGGVEVYNAIWGPLLRGKFSIVAEKISMAWLWARIHTRANSRRSILEKEQLGYFKHGFVSVAEKLLQSTAELLHKDTQQLLRKEQTILSLSPAKRDTVILKTTEESFTFDAVIGTIPTLAYQKLLPKGVLESHVEYLSAVLLVFTSEQSLSSYYWHNVIDQDAPFLAFLQHTNLAPPEWYNGKHVYYIGAYVPHTHELMAIEQKELEERWFRYLGTIFPQFNKNLAHDKHLFRFPHAQHIVKTDYESSIAPYKLSMPGTYMANFSQIFPEDRGTNFAVREGVKIANLVASDLEK